MTMQQQALPLSRRSNAKTTGSIAAIIFWSREMVEPGSKVLDVGCGDGDLLQLLESRGIDGRGIELSREGVNRCVAKGLAVVQGDADTDLVNYPDDAFDYVILSQTLAGDAAAQGGAGKPAADRPPRHRLVSEFRLLADAASASDRRPHAAHGKPARDVVRHAEHSFLHHQGFRAALRRDRRQDGARGRARSLRPAVAASTLPWWFWNMFGEQGVFLLSRGGEGEIAVEPHDCAGSAVHDVTMFGSLSRPGEPRPAAGRSPLRFNFQTATSLSSLRKQDRSRVRPKLSSSRPSEARSRDPYAAATLGDPVCRLSRDNVRRGLCQRSQGPTVSDTHPHPRGAIHARVVHVSFAQRGRGECRVASAPAASRGKNKNTRVSHHGRAGFTRHSRTRMVLTVSFALSLVSRALLSPSPRNAKHCRELTPASGHQDHTTSPSAGCTVRLVSAQPRPSHPAPTSVTIAKRPSVQGRGTAGLMDLIWAKREAIYFCSEGLDR